jgi:hypothetical protein
MPKTKKTKKIAPQETELERLQGIIVRAKETIGRAMFHADEKEKFAMLFKTREILCENKRHTFLICESCGSQNVRRIYVAELREALKPS